MNFIQKWNDVTKECKHSLAQAGKILSEILFLPKGTCRTIENTLEPFNEICRLFDYAGNKADLMRVAHPDQKIRAAAEAGRREVAAFWTQLLLNQRLYKAFRAVPRAGLDSLTGRFIDKTLLDFRLAGVDKDKATRRRLRGLVAHEIKLGQSFDRNIREDIRSIEIRPQELKGLPEDYQKDHGPNTHGKVVITTDYPDVFPFLKYAQNEQARLRLYKAFNNRGWPKNERILKQLLQLRRERAKLIGFNNWADYITKDKMAGSAAVVGNFIRQIANIAMPRGRRDYALLLSRKRKDVPDATFVGLWESAYYGELLRRERFSFNSQEVRRYFEFTSVKKGILDVTAELFGLIYRPVLAKTWHTSVEVYDVYLAGKKIGRIYLDLHPRRGKYKHAACFEIRAGITGKQLPAAALVCNFPKGLMEHSEVVTFFHEFGHLVHYLLAGNQRWVRFSGFATEWDFVETPSQLLEEWAWHPKVLERFAIDRKTGDPIPEDLIKRMRAAAEFGKGYNYQTQVFYASLSLRLHQTPSPLGIDLSRFSEGEQRRYSFFPWVVGTHFYTSFEHLNGYSAMYYTYLWSRVIAKDLFSRFERYGLLNRKVAHHYRDSILAAGGSKDARDMIRNFLGRNYTLTAFKRWLAR